MKKLLWTIGTALLLTVFFAISAVGVSAATEGTTGDCIWKLEGTHLTISGKGEMSNYGTDYNIAPWSSDITKVTIGKEVTSIGENAFYNCSDLEEFHVEAGNTVYTSKDGVLFNADKTTLLRFPAKKSGVYTVPGSVTTIESAAFRSCTALTSITIPNSVTTLKVATFYECTALETVDLPDTLTFINQQLFEGCSKLSEITIPDTVVTIGESAFKSCRSLINITIPNGVKTISSKAFYGCSNLKSITIGTGVVSIYDYAFYNCDLRELVIPDNVTYLGSDLISWDDTLDKLVLGDGITEVPSIPAKEWVLGDGITEIPNYTFKNNSTLTAITLGDELTSIGDFAFYGCPNLVYVGMNDNITHIGEEAFVNTGLYKDSQNWYKDVMYVGKYAVDAAPNLSGEGFIKENTLLIGQGAFYECTQLTAITIPDGVKAIGQYAFYKCNFTELVIPDSVTIIEPEAFEACSALTKVTLPGSITSIGNQAFKNCSALADVYYTGTEKEWQALTVESENQPLENATWHCDFEIPEPTQPTQTTTERNGLLQNIKSILRRGRSMAKMGLLSANRVYPYLLAAAILIAVAVIASSVVTLKRRNKTKQKDDVPSVNPIQKEENR